MPAPAYCPHCFYALDADAVTCPRCGQSVGNTDAPAPALSSSPTGASSTGSGQEAAHSDLPPPTAYAVYKPPMLTNDPPTPANGPVAADVLSDSTSDLVMPLPVRPVGSATDSPNGDMPATALPVRPAHNDTAV